MRLGVRFMQQSKTVLEKIGISLKIVKQWKSKGLKISYPMQARRNFFKSQDGKVFTESADKFVPPLTKEENILYTKYPEKFREDFLENVKLYFKFHIFLYEKSKEIEKLTTSEDKSTANLSLMYLFLSAMDHHYYHFDRYLAYQDYPDTPVGYWWKKLKTIHSKVFKGNSYETFLKTFSQDKKIMNEYKNKLSLKEFNELEKILEQIKIFEDVQEKEIKIISGYPSKEDLLLKTGFGIWSKLCDLIKEYPIFIQKKYHSEIVKLIDGHPIISTRILLLPLSLQKFDKVIFSEFKREINRWVD